MSMGSLSFLIFSLLLLHCRSDPIIPTLPAFNVFTLGPSNSFSDVIQIVQSGSVQPGFMSANSTSLHVIPKFTPWFNIYLFLNGSQYSSPVNYHVVTDSLTPARGNINVQIAPPGAYPDQPRHVQLLLVCHDDFEFVAHVQVTMDMHTFDFYVRKQCLVNYPAMGLQATIDGSACISAGKVEYAFGDMIVRQQDQATSERNDEMDSLTLWVLPQWAPYNFSVYSVLFDAALMNVSMTYVDGGEESPPGEYHIFERGAHQPKPLQFAIRYKCFADDGESVVSVALSFGPFYNGCSVSWMKNCAWAEEVEFNMQFFLIVLLTLVSLGLMCCVASCLWGRSSSSDSAYQYRGLCKRYCCAPCVTLVMGRESTTGQHLLPEVEGDDEVVLEDGGNGGAVTEGRGGRTSVAVLGNYTEGTVSPAESPSTLSSAATPSSGLLSHLKRKQQAPKREFEEGTPMVALTPKMVQSEDSPTAIQFGSGKSVPDPLQVSPANSETTPSAESQFWHIAYSSPASARAGGPGAGGASMKGVPAAAPVTAGGPGAAMGAASLKRAAFAPSASTPTPSNVGGAPSTASSRATKVDVTERKRESSIEEDEE